MGLVGTSLKYGTLFIVAKEGMKAYEKRNDKKQPQQQQPPPMVPIQQGSYGQPQPQYPQQARDVSSCFHQVWCNGQCGGKCGAADIVTGMESGVYSETHRRDEKLPPY